MRRQKHQKYGSRQVLAKAMAVVLVCGVTIGSVSVPIMAREDESSLHNAEGLHNVYEGQDVNTKEEESAKKTERSSEDVRAENDDTKEAAGSVGGDNKTDSGGTDKEENADRETSKKQEDGINVDDNTDEETDIENAEETDTGKDTDAEEPKEDANGADKDDPAGEESKNEEDGSGGSGTDKEDTSQTEDATGTDDGIEEGDAKGETEETDTGTGEEAKEEDNTVSGNDVETELPEDEGKESVSGNDIDPESKADDQKMQDMPETVDVVVPTAYTLALNPYRLPVRTGEDEVTTQQIISGMYGIVNKSSTDQIVTVSLTIEDGNGGELVFVDSAEEAREAGMNVYAIYLTAVPAGEEQILIEGEPVDEKVTGEALQNVRMTGAEDQAVVLHEGTNEMAFKLAKAVYDVEEESTAENTEDQGEDSTDVEESPGSAHEEDIVYEEIPLLQALASDGKGVTAYTFSGVMNPDAEWEKLSGGIRLSVVYTYETADGSEEIVEGTGAMINIE